MVGTMQFNKRIYIFIYHALWPLHSGLVHIYLNVSNEKNLVHRFSLRHETYV
jgi:hypothetical protein